MPSITKTDRTYQSILGVRVNSTSKAQVLKQIASRLEKRKAFVIYTPNPEILLEANKDSKLKNIINEADFAVPDGVGLKLASFLNGQPLLPTIKGRELFLDLVKLASEKGYKVFLLGSSSKVNTKAQTELNALYPKLKISGNGGPSLNSHGEPQSSKDQKIEREAITDIRKYKPDLVFVGFGAPKQELWTSKHAFGLNTGIMCVGGTFDYIAKAKPLPPNVFNLLGAEWLWRMITEKNHAKRVFRALILFPLTLLKFKLLNN